MELSRNFDIIAEAVEVSFKAQEDLRKKEKISFPTDPSLRGDLAVLCASLIRESIETKFMDPKVAEQSNDPLGDASTVLTQLHGSVDDELNLTLTGSMLDVVNVLFVKHIESQILVHPNIVRCWIMRFENLNIDYQKACGLESPIYTEFIRQREEMR